MLFLCCLLLAYITLLTLQAVKALTSLGDIKVMLTPEVAAKFSHYYSVDNQHILLFDPKPVPGFGGNHLPTDSIQYSSDSSLEGGDGVGGGDGDGKDENEDICNGSDGPDLICTLGGDGLLMHARCVRTENTCV